MLLGLRTWSLGGSARHFFSCTSRSQACSISCLSGLFAAIVRSSVGPTIGRQTVRSLLASQVAVPVGPNPHPKGQSHFRRTKIRTVPGVKIETVPLKAKSCCSPLFAIVPTVVALGLLLGLRISTKCKRARFCHRTLVAGDADVGFAALEDGPDRSRRRRRSRQRGADGIRRANPGRGTLTVGLVRPPRF